MLRIRQLALAARTLEPVRAALEDALALTTAYRDPGVAVFGLENAVLPVGRDFLEIVTPTRTDTAAGRWLERRGGDGGYMVILQTDDLGPLRRRLDSQGVRVVWEIDRPEAQAVHLHPRDVGGAILSFDRMAEAEEWAWAGPAWRDAVRTERVSGIAVARLTSPEPSALAARWSSLLDRPARSAAGGLRIELDGNALEFAPGERDGLTGVDLRSPAPERALEDARAAGAEPDGDGVCVGGVRFRFLPEP
jgi:hypothetical protein